MPSTELRPVALWQPDIRFEERDDGTMVVWQAGELGAYPRCMSDRIRHWAETAPDRSWMAERASDGSWKRVTYAQLQGHLERVGSFLLRLGLDQDNPLLILSENSLEHAIIALAGQHVGIPTSAIAPAYSLHGGGHQKLHDIAAQLRPGAIFAKDVEPFAPAINAVFGKDVPVISAFGRVSGRRCYSMNEACGFSPTEAGAAAAASVTPDMVAKLMFTSGTTGSPKAVIQTHRMICANMEMVRDAYSFLKDEPPVLVDWAPWNHVASGNKVFNIAPYNGGTCYIDDGKPTPGGIAKTIRNLREIAPSWYFNVPAGFEMLIEAMDGDEGLAQNFFARLRLILYAGAGMADHTWKSLERLSIAATGARTLITSGLGSAETAPFATFCHMEQTGPGNIGIPAKGLKMKLAPEGGKMEVRFKGPSITPGYWEQPELTAQAFDEEGYYKMGDALRMAVPGDPAKGFIFDGRVAENFKLQTGTWVSVGSLRAKLVDALDGLARDAVITGENREELGALIVPFRPALERLVTDGTEMSDEALFAAPEVRARLLSLLQKAASQASGSSTRIVRALVLAEPLALDAGEITDKGSVNQRAVLRNRADLVERLYSDHPAILDTRVKDTA